MAGGRMVCGEKPRGRNVMQRDGDNKMSVERIERKLDSSNRVKIPKRWLAMAGRCKCVCLMPDPKEGCLRLISQGDIEKRMAKLREKALTDPAVYRAVQIIGKRRNSGSSILKDVWPSVIGFLITPRSRDV